MAGTDGNARAGRGKLVSIAAFALLAFAAPPSAAGDMTAGAVPAVEIGQADSVYVDKSERRLDLLRDGEVIASFEIALGFAPGGHKTEEGDGKTPEGDYLLDWRNPQSRFHLSLHVSYPNAADRAQADTRGVSPGGDIFIHGTPTLAALRGGDWTLGCIAVSNGAIETIWTAVPDGTPITISP